MKKTLIALFALAGAAMADQQILTLGTWDLGASVLPEQATTTLTLVSSIDPSVSLTIASTNGTNLAAGTTTKGLGVDEWASYEQMDSNINVAEGTMEATHGTYICNPTEGNAGGADLLVTISGLHGGAKYNVSFISGYTDTSTGSWTAVTTANAYERFIANNITGNTTLVPKASLGSYAIEGLEADSNGNIVLTIDRKSFHTACLNGLGVALAPEPATATLSLLALAGLAARRRRH